MTAKTRVALLNVLLLVLLAMSLGWYFWRHFYLAVKPGLETPAGGGATLLIVLGAAAGLVKWAVGQIKSIMTEVEAKQWKAAFRAFLQRRLGQRWLSWGCGLLIAVSIVLHFGTSSIYVQRAEKPDDAAFYEAQVVLDGTSSTGALTYQLDSPGDVKGRPFFGFSRREGKVTLNSPRGRSPFPVIYGGGRATLVTAPTDFTKRKFHVLRILPMPFLIGHLPTPGGETPEVPYQLRLTVNGSPPQSLVEDLREGTLLLGGTKEDLQWLSGQHPVDISPLQDALQLAGILPVDQQQFLDVWQEGPVVLKTSEFKVGDLVTIEVVQRDQVIAREQVPIAEDDAAILAVHLEAAP